MFILTDKCMVIHKVSFTGNYTVNHTDNYTDNLI